MFDTKLVEDRERVVAFILDLEAGKGPGDLPALHVAYKEIWNEWMRQKMFGWFQSLSAEEKLKYPQVEYLLFGEPPFKPEIV